MESHNLPGGCATSFSRGRYEFESSLHELCDIGENTACRKMLSEEYGIHLPLTQVPEMLRTIYDSKVSGKHVDLTLPLGKESCLKALIEAFPKDEKGFNSFFSFLEECASANAYFSSIGGKLSFKGKIHFLKHYIRYIALAYQPFNAVCRKLGLSEEAIEALDSYWSYLGADMEEIAFVHYGTLFHAYCLQGPYLFKGTSHTFANTLIERIRELGGDIYFSTKADKVISDEKGHILGVRCGDSFYEADSVIANMSPHNAYAHLLDEKIKIPKRERGRVRGSKISIKLTNIYLGLDKPHEELGINNYTVFLNNSLNGKPLKEESPLDYGALVATCYNVADKGYSPSGTTMLTITLMHESAIWGEVAPEEYEGTKWQVAEKAIKVVEEKLGYDIRGHIEEIEVATPVTVARYIGTPEGTPYGYKQTKRENIVARMVAKKGDQSIKGFATVGAFGSGGDGYVQNLNEGRSVAKKIIKDLEGKP